MRWRAGESIWDRFASDPAHIEDRTTPAVTCDHFHRYRDDLALMASLGLKNCRLSIAWPRVIPDGDGQVDAAGLDFYDRLVDAMLERGIRPLTGRASGGTTVPGVRRVTAVSRA